MIDRSEIETTDDAPTLVAGKEAAIEDGVDVPADTLEFRRSFVEWLDKSPPADIARLCEVEPAERAVFPDD